jgi:signal peptidase II
MSENEKKEELKIEPSKIAEKAKPEKFQWTWKNFFFSFLWLAVLVWAMDISSKWIVVNAARQFHTDSFSVIPNFFYIDLTFNTGSSFGFGSSDAWARYIFIIVSWVASGAILFYWIKLLPKKDAWIDCVFALCLAGAFGNAIDRTFYWNATVGFNGVVDFFEFFIFGPANQPFAIFNVADSSLCVGIGLLVLVEIVRAVKSHKKGMAE